MRAKRPCLFCGRPTRKGETCCVLVVDDRSTREYRRVRARVLAEKGTTCHLCGEPGADTVDHVVPIARGGRSTFENLEPAHLACNSSRGDLPASGHSPATRRGAEMATARPPASTARPGGRAIFESTGGGEPAPRLCKNPASGVGVSSPGNRGAL